MSKKRLAKWILILIITLFSVEYLGIGEISVYRVGILPLSVIGLITILGLRKSNRFVLVSFVLSLYMLFYSVCLLSVDDNFLFPILCIPLLLFLIGFWSLKEPISVDYSKVFLWFFLPHLISFLTGTANYVFARFSGLHSDPNFCGIFLSFSILSAFSLIRREKEQSIGLFKKIIVISIAVISLFLLLLTGSRGAMFSLAFVVLLELIMGGVKKKYVIAGLLVAGIAGFHLYQYILALPDWVSPDVSLVDSVLCRFKPDTISEGSSRIDIWTGVFKNIEDERAWFYPIGRIAAMRGLSNTYTHNTYIDFFVDNGVVLGAIIVIAIVFMAAQVLLYHHKDVNLYEHEFTLCCFSILIQLFFLSAIQQKILWLCLAFIVYKACIGIPLEKRRYKI